MPTVSKDALAKVMALSMVCLPACKERENVQSVGVSTQHSLSKLDSETEQLKEVLYTFEIEGKKTFGEDHVWQMPGYEPGVRNDMSRLTELYESSLSRDVTKLWRERAKTRNLPQAEAAAESYNRIRLYCSHAAFIIEHGQNTSATDAMTLKPVHEGLRMLEMFEQKVKPFFNGNEQRLEP